MGHLRDDALSAYSDGELPASEAEAARAHLSSCATCRHELATFGQLDALLAAAPALSCTAVRPLLSALIDDETDTHETAAVSLHLTSCADCRAQRQHWQGADAAICALPAGVPSARVDAAMAALGERRRGVAPGRRRVLVGPAFAGAVASGLMAVAAVMGGGQVVTQTRAQPVPAANTLFGPVAVQQVLNTKTNTLYALRPDTKTVAALDPFSKLQRASIPLAAKPITLALNEDANRIYVVDVERSLTEIDGASNTVVSTTPNVVTGTPTAISYDPAKKQIVVAASVPARTAAPITSNAPSASPPSGEVVVLDSSSKRTLESRTVDAAPQIVVLDESGTRALLVSSDGTRVVNAATYEVALSLPGGVAGAFATNGHIAVLSSTSGGSRMQFFGNGAPGALDMEGAPVAVTALPRGGFGVLVDVNGKGRVYIVDVNGRLDGRVDVVLGGRILTYDGATQRFAVIGSEVAYAALPASSAAPSAIAAASPSPTQAPASSAPASGSPATSAQP
ncbi:MAG: zf-HC2 domain-containing protein, partial [Chloroflexota bacterium]